jgi:hypothetical protein
MFNYTLAIALFIVWVAYYLFLSVDVVWLLNALHKKAVGDGNFKRALWIKDIGESITIVSWTILIYALLCLGHLAIAHKEIAS